MKAIEINNLTKKYGDLTAVSQLNLTVEQGELFSLLGVNGAGKTTTIKMLSCLTEPTDGDAYLMGHSILKEKTQVKEVIGVSPQETAVAPGLTGRENLELICGAYGFDKEKRRQKVEELTRLLSLDSIFLPSRDRDRVVSARSRGSRYDFLRHLQPT